METEFKTYAATFLDFRNGVVWLHSVAIHGHVMAMGVGVSVRVGMAVLVGSLHLCAFAGTLRLDGCLDNSADLLQRSLDVLGVGEHLADLALRGKALRDWLRALLLLGDAAIGFGKVEDCARMRANLVGLIVSKNWLTSAKKSHLLG